VPPRKTTSGLYWVKFETTISGRIISEPTSAKVSAKVVL
jgi:hypothetical protein